MKLALGRAALGVFGAVVAILVLELGLRLQGRTSPEPETHSWSESLYDYDASLGWVVRPHVTQEQWGVSVRTGADGIRSNGEAAPHDDRGATILVFGDSFTFGDEVADGDTWPARLQSRLNDGAIPARVVNAGVSSYGIDQMVIRAEQLVPRYSPRVVVFAFVSDDLLRTVQSVRHGLAKPYFVRTSSGFELRNVPAPRLALAAPWRQALLHHSVLATTLSGRWPFDGLLARGTTRDFRHPPGQSPPADIGRYLLRRLATLREAHGFDLVVALLPQDPFTPSEGFAASHALLRELEREEPGIAVVDVATAVRARTTGDPVLAERVFPSFFNGHMSGEGNGLVADIVQPAVVPYLPGREGVDN